MGPRSGNNPGPHPFKQDLPERPGFTMHSWRLGGRPTEVALSQAAPNPDDGFAEVSRSKSTRRGQLNAMDSRQSVSTSPAYQSLDRRTRQSQFSTSAPSAGPEGRPGTDAEVRGRPSQNTSVGGRSGPNLGSLGRPGQSVGVGGRPGRNAPQTSSGFSYYKQSALPVDQRDPVLVEVEQNKGRTIAKALYKPGMIVRAILHEPHFDATPTVVDRNRTQSVFGPIHSKYRKMIIIALFEDHYIAIPMYTHQGNGLARKGNPDEYVSVRDHRSKVPHIALSAHHPLETEMLNSGVEPYDAASTAHVTYPVSRSYDSPVVQEGQIASSSLLSLLQLYIKCGPKVKVNPYASKQARM